MTDVDIEKKNNLIDHIQKCLCSGRVSCGEVRCDDCYRIIKTAISRERSLDDAIMTVAMYQSILNPKGINEISKRLYIYLCSLLEVKPVYDGDYIDFNKLYRDLIMRPRIGGDLDGLQREPFKQDT